MQPQGYGLGVLLWCRESGKFRGISGLTGRLKLFLPVESVEGARGLVGVLGLVGMATLDDFGTGCYGTFKIGALVELADNAQGTFSFFGGLKIFLEWVAIPHGPLLE
jgi:hypothetical protein